MIGRDIRIHSPAEHLAKSSKMVSGIASLRGKRNALPDQGFSPLDSTNFVLGGGERIRTDDLLRARQALSHLSYTPQKNIADFGVVVVFKSKIRKPISEIAWWAWMELNHRPHAYQACALTKLSYRPQMILDLGSQACKYRFIARSKIRLSPSFISKC
jgi:hypothetical protein